MIHCKWRDWRRSNIS